MSNNILLSIYNITNFNKFIDVLNNYQYESTEIIIELFIEYLNQYKIIIFNDTIITNLKKILKFIFTFKFIDIIINYKDMINDINDILKNKNTIINTNDKKYLEKIINNNFRNEDLKIFLKINYNNIIIYRLQFFYKTLINIFSYDKIIFINENLNIIINKYNTNTLYNKLLIHFNIYYKNINSKNHFDKIIYYLSSNNIENLSFYLLYDIIYYIINNIND